MPSPVVVGDLRILEMKVPWKKQQGQQQMWSGALSALNMR